MASVLPRGRERYLAEIAERVRGYRVRTAEQVEAVRDWDHVRHTNALVGTLNDLEGEKAAMIDPDVRAALDSWPSTRQAYSGEELVYTVRGRDIHTPLTRETLSGSLVRRVALPPDDEPGAIVRFLRSENLPGYFPFTAGVFPVKRSGEAPARMFAGEGDPARTNRRFHLLSEGQPATRLSTAFDSVTLYGRDPSPRLDIYGKVGTSGVSVATIEDMRDLYAGFDLCSPTTSVSMTINGPAPAILAMFLNVAIDQQLAAHPDEDPASVRARTLASVRGTVQADILKEDQGQNTCIFSTEFALRAMADMQQWFIDQDVRNFYSVSISGYHIAEAGANPISQLAFTLANGFTYVEALPCPRYGRRRFRPEPVLLLLQRHGCRVHGAGPGGPAHLGDRHAGSVRRRRACPETQVPRADVGARSLHAQEMSFNDIRTTLQALCALYDNANSLHTNAFDEAITTPTADSVRRALAIQMIIDQEWGLSMNENPLQGSYIVNELTDLVEEAVMAEFVQLADRGGVLGAMETGYQRGKIQDKSVLYEHRKHDGSLPIVGVNTFVADDPEPIADLELARRDRG